MPVFPCLSLCEGAPKTWAGTPALKCTQKSRIRLHFCILLTVLRSFLAETKVLWSTSYIIPPCRSRKRLSLTEARSQVEGNTLSVPSLQHTRTARLQWETNLTAKAGCNDAILGGPEEITVIIPRACARDKVIGMIRSQRR